MKPYRRKLSGQGAETGTILITKDGWNAFPPPMKEFDVRVGRLALATRIVAEDCVCVPPLHRHLQLEAGHFRHLLEFSKGAIVENEVRDGSVRSIRNG